MLKFQVSLFVVLAAAISHADLPGAHPAYLHALEDLRTARGHLEKRGGSAALQQADQLAIAAIDQCVTILKQGATEDGKNLSKKVHEDDGKDQAGHVHRAHELLEKAKKDVSAQESNTAADGTQTQAIQCLTNAIQQVEKSLAIKN